jgi:aryl-alcohol dehydrogenase-like predicted oxidoreductase
MAIWKMVKRRKLGQSGLTVPVIGMGTWQSFDTEDDRVPLAIQAIDFGVTLFDSSPMYGRSERTLARALAGRRDQAQVATKIWTSDPEEAANRLISLSGCTAG